MVMEVLKGCGNFISIPIFSSSSTTKTKTTTKTSTCVVSCNLVTTRRTIVFSGVASYLLQLSPIQSLALAQQQQDLDETQQEEDRVVRLFEETIPSVVCIKDLELVDNPKSSDEVMMVDGETAKVEGTGSGFIWDKYSWLTKMEITTRNGKIYWVDPSSDVDCYLKRSIDVEGIEVKPVDIGSARKLNVGQSCYAIGNPYGYENTLTTGIVSGLGREIPSPNMGAIRGAIQTDAAINSGNSGGPLLDSHGHVIGVNTATFTRKGSGMSSGVNFAIPIDTVVHTVPYLIVYGTAYRDRF
ncbi:protease Do-like protein 5, chloroplastic [Tanacetum coccineum]